MRMPRVIVPLSVSLAVGVALSGLPAGASAQQSPGDEPAAQVQAGKPAIYDTAADAKVQIAAALTKAKRENQRVLVMFGGNWCSWCHKLHELFRKDRTIAKALLYEYQLVLVDIGKHDKHTDVAAGYGADLKKAGVPFLTVLDADGKVLANQETGALEAGDRHDPKLVSAFLGKWRAEPLDAEKLLSAALARAGTEEKSVFLHLGAPWCGWCRRLEDFMARQEIATILAQDFIDLKIDVDRTTHGKQVAQRIRGSTKGGIPWFAILDGQGQVLATSDGPKGNVGFPVEPHEIGHFIGVLKKTARRMSAEQLGTIEKALEESAAKLKRRG
jgi:thiol:disulfide interchange protein